VPDTIAFDFDGTLIDLDPIAHLWGDWDSFHGASFDCPAREMVVEFARRCQLIAKTVVITGKPERYRAKLVGWLALHGLQPDELLMRPDHVTMPDAELKPALLFDLLGPNWKDKLIAVVEDRDKMVDAWRKEGVLCLQAAPCIETRIKKGLINEEAN
jgi:hypothetical protein